MHWRSLFITNAAYGFPRTVHSIAHSGVFIMRTQLETDLTERDLDSMERRSRTAAPGPWISYVVGRDFEAGLNYIEVSYCDTMEVLGASAADQDFIAHARDDLPRLINEVRRLRAELNMRNVLIAIDTARDVVSTPASPVTC